MLYILPLEGIAAQLLVTKLVAFIEAVAIDVPEVAEPASVSLDPPPQAEMAVSAVTARAALHKEK